MDVSKENDIRLLIQQTRDRNSSLKDKKFALVKALDILQDVASIDEINVSWRDLIDDLCLPALLKTDRSEVRKNSGKVISFIGVLLFESDEFSEFLEWLNDLYANTPKRSEDARAEIALCVFHILKEMSGEKKSFNVVYGIHVEKCLNWTRDIIDSASNSVYAHCLKILTLVSNAFPAHFDQIFEEIMNLTCLSRSISTISDKNFRLFAEFVETLEQFFSSRSEFATTLAESLLNRQKNVEDLRDMRRQMKILVAVVKANNDKSILIKMIEKISNKLETYYDDPTNRSDCFMIFADTFNDLLMVDKDDGEITTIMENCIPKILQPNIFENSSYNDRRNVIRMISQMVKRISALSDIKSKIIEIIFDDKIGLFVADRRNILMLTGRDQMYQCIADIISSLLAPTSFLHLQMTYTAVRQTMIESIKILRETENLASELIEWHEMKLILLLYVIQPISNAKSSLTVMGITPPVFEFLSQELPLTQEWFCNKHATVYHMLVHLLTGHLRCHEYYIEHSDYLVKYINSPIGQSKREYTRKQVIALTLILKFDIDKIWKKTRFLISSWASSLVDTAITMKIDDEVFSSREWIKFKMHLLTQSMFSINDENLSIAVSRLSAVKNWDDRYLLSKDVIEKIKNETWKTSAAVWEAGDCKVYIRQSLSEGYQMLQESHQKNVPPSSFGIDEFMSVTNFLLKSMVPSTFVKGSYNWMDDYLELIANGCIISGDKKVEIPKGFIEKWRWALSQTANFCISNKMKTPYGKPMDTFNAFSSEISRLAKNVLTGNVKTNSAKEESEKRSLRHPIEWLRVRLLLEFVDILDKMMNFIISGGASFNLLEASTTSRQFFIMNQQSCLEWLHRTYYPALVVAYFNGEYAMTIRFGWSALQIYQNREKDERSKNMVFLICCWMCRAMVALSVPKHISGMIRWIRVDYREDYSNSSWELLEAMETMAAGRYETALIMFEEILMKKEPVGDTIKFIIHNAVIDILNRIRMPEIVDYYRNVLFAENESTSEDFKSVELLTKFTKIGNNEKRKVVDWNIKQSLMEVEAAFSQTMRKTEIADIRKDMGAIGALMLGADASCRLYSDISSSNLVISYLIDKTKNPKNDLSVNPLFDHRDDYNQGEKLAICRKVMQWATHLKHYRGYSPDAHTEIIRLSRKTQNKQLTFWHMKEALKGDNVTPWMRLEIARQNLKVAKDDSLDVQIREMNGLFGTLADVFMTSCQLKQNFNLLPEESQRQDMIEKGYLEEMKLRDDAMSRSCIQLATFFDSFPDNQNILLPEFSNSLFWGELNRRSMPLGVGYRSLVGSLLFLSSEINPKLAKSHLKYAQWAYELAQVRNFKVTNPLFSYISFDEDAKKEEKLWQCLENSTAGQLEKGIRKVEKRPDVISSLLAPNGTFLKMWGMVKEHRVKFLSIAAQSYFAFIQNSSGPHPYSKKEETTVATLRILDMLVRDGDILINLIENGLDNTNVHIWKEILPQLFARLSHPSENIRNTLVNLISRVGRAAPHAVVFQVVSGTASSQVSNDIEGLEDEQQIAQNDNRSKVHECCEQLEKELAQSYPSLVRDVRSFVNELEKINLLNEEKWAVVLGTIEQGMEKRLALIRSENAATLSSEYLSESEKQRIIAEKPKLMMSQIFDVLDELYRKTCVEEGITENEKQFQSNFGKQLAAAFTESKLNREHPEKAWAPFKNLISTLVHRNMKRGMQSFDIDNISPYLANLHDSCVPMPGQDSVDFDKVVTISSVSKPVTILPTKTRPKKLAFVGNDGKTRTFLFKGKEDLHLDERVMQFLRLCNVMLNPGKLNRTSSEYEAHHYSVIPLGPRSGLIKWVEGATPLYTLYRKWKNREKAFRQVTKEKGEAIAEVERPTEMYHRMIREAFAEHNIDTRIISERWKWPPNIMREVFDKLVQKTPKDLISRELWMRSGCATTWWNVTTRFARSYAVMCMIGSVLGLGDRHLDNILVDLTRGHVVHIDYNVCFDKGRILRIPETVPFRLTQNMVHALGPAHVHGAFRESCVHVLSTLRNGKQALTMLLDAFVFDPLVDWTNHENGGSNGISFAMQLAVYGSEWKTKVSQSNAELVKLFELRICELSKPLIQNREDFRSSLQEVSECLSVENPMEIGWERVEAGRRLRDTLNRHHSLMKNLRPLIRSISRNNRRFADYYTYYKKYFSDPILEGHSSLSDEKDLDIETSTKKFSIVLDHLDLIFDKLLNLSSATADDSKAKIKIMRPPGINVWVVNEEQVENVMARGLVLTVAKRLNGFTLYHSNLLSPSEQADALIEQAMRVPNLVKMYEGWTAWV